jgi:hypothetical protein
VIGNLGMAHMGMSMHSLIDSSNQIKSNRMYIDSSAALYSSTALATPKSLRLPAAPTTFRLQAHSSTDVAPRRVSAPSPDRFSDLSSLPSSPIALRKPVERLLSLCLPTAVSRPDPSSLRPSTDASGRSRAHREAKRQKKRRL